MAPVSPRWEDARTVAGFVTAEPNAVLMDFAARVRARTATPRCLDLGCGAGRNALPLARVGFDVTGLDLSAPMLAGARDRLRAEAANLPVQLVRAPMAPLPFADRVFDLVVAHGIWNLARSGREFRAAVTEAARVARDGAGLFLFTFSRHTLPPAATPDAGESFVFSSWNGEPQCFLTEAEVVAELERAGFTPESPGPLTEYNRPRRGTLPAGGPPVIYEGVFVKRGADTPVPAMLECKT